MGFDDELTRSEVLGTSALSAILLLGVILTGLRSPAASSAEQRLALVRWLLPAIAVQCLHCAEELVTGFHQRWPERFGLVAWTPEFFVAFNLAWVAIWLVSAVGILWNARVAYAPIWFFAIAMTGNGIVHPLCAIEDGAYFPGLYTAPFAGIFGVIVLVALCRVTSNRRQ